MDVAIYKSSKGPKAKSIKNLKSSTMLRKCSIKTLLKFRVLFLVKVPRHYYTNEKRHIPQNQKGCRPHYLLDPYLANKLSVQNLRAS